MPAKIPSMSEITGQPKPEIPYWKEVVDAALAVDPHFLNWTAQMEPKIGLEFIRRAEVYNRMDHAGMLGLFGLASRICPKQDYGPGNPNSGRKSYHFIIGNEYSRVIFVVFEKYATQRTDKEWAKTAERIIAHAKTKAGADEATIDKNDHNYLKVRLWWD